MDRFWLTEVRMKRIAPFVPRSHGRPRVDDRRGLSGIVHVLKHGGRWRDAPACYGPHKTLYKTLYNRFVRWSRMRWSRMRWSRMGVFDRIFAELAADAPSPDEVLIDGSHLKAHRTAASLLKGGAYPAASGEPKAG